MIRAFHQACSCLPAATHYKVLALGLFLAAACATRALAFGAIVCQWRDDQLLDCMHSQDERTESASISAAFAECNRLRQPDARCATNETVRNTCVAVYQPYFNVNYIAIKRDPDLEQAKRLAYAECSHEYLGCVPTLAFCDGTPAALSLPAPVAVPTRPVPVRTGLNYHLSDFVDLDAVRTGISFGIGIIIALLVFAYRAAIANYIIHGNLPRTLPVYAEDIQVLFKRTQRVNWYGRVVFGVIARLGMTEKQLSLVRRYWLGRVIAFDSLRRQRQNELARLHVQFAMQAKSDPHDKKKFWSRAWAAFRTLIKRLFWIFTALFNLLFGFLFIRVTIAKLARGKLIESKDLVLVLQAKDAIELSAKYLKEYLTTAETFDGREELFESK